MKNENVILKNKTYRIAHVQLPYDRHRLTPSDRLDDDRVCGDRLSFPLSEQAADHAEEPGGAQARMNIITFSSVKILSSLRNGRGKELSNRPSRFDPQS